MHADFSGVNINEVTWWKIHEITFMISLKIDVHYIIIYRIKPESSASNKTIIKQTHNYTSLLLVAMFTM